MRKEYLEALENIKSLLKDDWLLCEETIKKYKRC